MSSFLLLTQGMWNNLKEVLTWTCIPEGDGIDWNLSEGCDKYALTVTLQPKCLVVEFFFIEYFSYFRLNNWNKKQRKDYARENTKSPKTIQARGYHYGRWDSKLPAGHLVLVTI